MRGDELGRFDMAGHGYMTMVRDHGHILSVDVRFKDDT
jgi:hypothetical protein